MPLENAMTSPRPPAPDESARYTREMLESLKKIAIQQRQPLLAHLLDLAAHEARSLGTQEKE